MLNPKFAIVAFLLLSACATAPAKPAVEVSGPQDDYSIQLERRADELIASDPNAVPPGLEVTVLSVDQVGTGLFYKVQLRVPPRGGRAEQQYIIYGQCETTDIDRCARQILSGAKMLRK